MEMGQAVLRPIASAKHSQDPRCLERVSMDKMYEGRRCIEEMKQLDSEQLSKRYIYI